MATPAGDSNHLGPVITQRSSEFIQIPYDLEMFDQILTRDEFKSVYQFLAHLSAKWYIIGVLLSMPKSKLDEIEENHRDVSRRLMQMIDGWLSNGKDCTWRALATALREDGHIEEANLIVQRVSEGPTTDFKEPQKRSSKNQWEEMKNQMCKKEEEFHANLASIDSTHVKYMEYLRDELAVSTGSGHEQMLDEIEEHVLQMLSNGDRNKIDAILHNFDKISKNLQSTPNSLQIWVETVTTDVKEVCDSLQMLTAQKESLKESLFKLQTEGIQHNEPNNQQIRLLELKAESRTQARAITQEIHDARCYQQYLINILTTCTTHLDIAINQNETIKLAANSTTMAYKEVTFIEALICLLLIALSIRNKTVVVTVVLIIACLVLIMLLIKLISPCVKRTMHKVNYIRHATTAVRARNRKFVSALLGVCLAIMPLLLLPPQPLPPQQPFKIKKTYISGVMLGFTGTVVLLSINRDIRGFYGIPAFFFFTLNLIYLTSEFSTALASFVIPIGIGIAAALYRNNMKFIVCIVAELILSLLLVLPIYYIGRLISQSISNYMGPVSIALGAALGGATAALCMLQLASRTSFPFIFTDFKMANSLKCLDQNIYKLKLLRVNISRTQSQATSLTSL